MKSKYAGVLCVFLVAVSQPFSSPAQPPAPTPTPATEITPTVESASIAFIEGKWVKAETKTVSATVLVDSQAKWVRVKVARVVVVNVGGQKLSVLSAEPVSVVEIATKAGRCFGLQAKSGTYQVEVTCADPESGLELETIQLTIGKPDDTDTDEGDDEDDDDEGDDTDKDIPEDRFDNLGRRVAEWSSGLPKRQQIGGIYAEWARKLSSDPRLTINTASAGMVQDRDGTLEAAKSTWQPFIDRLNADFLKWWDAADEGLNRYEVVEYWKAVSEGLK